MMNFVCIKWGDKYPAKYVNNLYNMVKKNYARNPASYTFTCYTDDVEGIECDTAPIPDDGILHPKHWFEKETFCFDRAKFLVFNSHNWLGYEGNWCYFDLDIVIQEEITDIEQLAQKPRIIHTRWQPQSQKHDRLFIDIRGTFYNSSMMTWPGKACEHIYKDAIENSESIFKTFFKGSDNYHYWRQRDFWKDIPGGWVYSWNRGKHHPEDVERFKFRSDAKICLFNTDNVPHPSAKEQQELSDCHDENIIGLWK
jgi:hypothetical protein